MTRPGWTVTDKDRAKRADGVWVALRLKSAGRSWAWFVEKARFDKNGAQSPYPIRLTSPRGNDRPFGSMEAAMKAADKDWPLQQKDVAPDS